MFHDPDAYDYPDEFIPERFLASEFGTKSGADNGGRRHDLHFGGGRVRSNSALRTSMFAQFMSSLSAYMRRYELGK